MKWIASIITILALAFALLVPLATSPAIVGAAAPVASTDTNGIFISIFSECEVAHTLPCENVWDVVATAHDAVFITFRGYSWEGVQQILVNNDWYRTNVAIFYHDVYHVTITDTSGSLVAVSYHPDDQTAITNALSVASLLHTGDLSVEVAYLR